eukprot:GFYU01042451.1.p1 GENE.GFYU01042451.1~~GFYU01042451.1.p1  ORF type:complete len:123 (-),score=28.25 GFYU01042451.1:112-456(-)
MAVLMSTDAPLGTHLSNTAAAVTLDYDPLELLFTRLVLGGMVGVMDLSGALFLWDQLFMLGWKKLQQFCVELLMFMRDELLGCHHIDDIISVCHTRPIIIPVDEFRGLFNPSLA